MASDIEKVDVEGQKPQHKNGSLVTLAGVKERQKGAEVLKENQFGEKGIKMVSFKNNWTVRKMFSN